MITIVRYLNHRKNEWDKFVSNSKNGVFFFLRDYVEYHSNRFTDCSLMFYSGQKLRAVFPANIYDNTLSSHDGLSFGGLVLDSKTTTLEMSDIFLQLLKSVKKNLKVKTIVYKCIPHIYHIHPSQEDLFFLYQAEAKLVSRKPSAVIRMRDKSDFQNFRKRAVKRAIKNEVIVEESKDYKSYWDIVTKNLMDRHKVKTTHSLAEIEYLRTKFSKYIKLFVSFKNEKMIAGVVMYESKNVARAQYIATTSKGKQIGALDIIFDYLINTHYVDKDYFDFGVSTETYLVNGKLVLNEGLVFQKEGFGGRSVMYDTYKIKV